MHSPAGYLATCRAPGSQSCVRLTVRVIPDDERGLVITRGVADVVLDDAVHTEPTSELHRERRIDQIAGNDPSDVLVEQLLPGYLFRCDRPLVSDINTSIN